jgi:pyruvate formate lyase activating enzyme
LKGAIPIKYTAKIHSVETCGTVDGPGLRYVAFFQGCRLRCKYCHNPDTWRINGGTEMTICELMSDILKYQSYMKFSGGGFTASGGEPLLQAPFITELFRRLKREGFHTALDTSGHGDPAEAEELFAHTDLVLMDIKSIYPEKFKELTAVDIHTTLRLTQYLSAKKIPAWIRFVVVPGLSDSEAEMEDMAEYLKSLSNIERVELLPFHKMGEHKWAEMKLPYALGDTPVPHPRVMKRLMGILEKHGLPV